MHISPFPIPLLWDVPCQIQLVCSLPGRVSKENTQPLRAKSAIAGSGGLCDSEVSISKPVCKHISLILQRRIFIIIIVFALYLLIPLSSPCLSLSLSQLILKFGSKKKCFVVISYVSANRCNNTAHTQNPTKPQ